MKKLLCLLGLHKWKSGPEYIEAHNPAGGQPIRHYANPSGTYKPFRDCIVCGKRQILMETWGWQ